MNSYDFFGWRGVILLYTKIHEYYTCKWIYLSIIDIRFKIIEGYHSLKSAIADRSLRYADLSGWNEWEGSFLVCVSEVKTKSRVQNSSLNAKSYLRYLLSYLKEVLTNHNARNTFLKLKYPWGNILHATLKGSDSTFHFSCWMLSIIKFGSKDIQTPLITICITGLPDVWSGFLRTNKKFWLCRNSNSDFIPKYGSTLVYGDCPMEKCGFYADFPLFNLATWLIIYYRF